MQELETVKSELAAERGKSSELGSQVAKMNQIISASQEALQQEQKTVELLKQAKVFLLNFYLDFMKPFLLSIFLNSSNHNGSPL